MDRKNPTPRPAATVSRPALRRMEGLTRGRRTPGDGASHREARTELSAWLVAGREAKGLTREQVAQITRIQGRTIERLEEARFDELPADVFVRGFIRGYARCVGLPVDEALARYGSCGFAAAPVASAQAQALLESMSSLAPPTAVRTGLGRAPRILDDGPGATGDAAGDAASDDELAAVAAAAPMVVPMAAGTLRELAAVPATTEAEAPVAAPAAAAPAAPGATAVEAAVVVTDAEAAQPSTRKRRKKGEAAAAPATGPKVRDAKGRFIRRTAEMMAVDPVALGLEAEAGASASDLVVPPSLVAAASDAAIEIVFDAPAEPGSPEPTAAASPAVAEAAPVASVVEVERAGGTSVEAAADDADAPTGASTDSRVASSPPAASGLDESMSATTTGTFLSMPPRTSGILVAPTLVIDDDDPEDAERAREERLERRKDADKGWRSFIPPALLDQQRGRQGGLTLAVIILLIVATLTLSYLMRRPSSAGEGITARDTAGPLVG